MSDRPGTFESPDWGLTLYSEWRDKSDSFMMENYVQKAIAKVEASGVSKALLSAIPLWGSRRCCAGSFAELPLSPSCRL